MKEELDKFIGIYARTNSLSEKEVSQYVGALTYRVLRQTDGYKKFVLTLGQIAPQLIQMNEVLGKSGE